MRIRNFNIKLLMVCFGLIAMFLPMASVQAREVSQITDWYIKDFQSDIVVNKDSSLDITEKITADCGNLPDKHGIFRILPLFYQKTSSEKVKIPIKLVSITDFNGADYNYSQSRDSQTVTWKIGDANKTVSGNNNYKIVYHVDNTMRLGDANFDEFYWNLNGNFWDIETDHFQATIHFPVEPLDKNINLYSGAFGDKDADLAKYSWTDSKNLSVESTQPLKIGEGITTSVTFTKNYFVPYTPSFSEKYGSLFWLIIPFLVFYFCYKLWRKYGRDPKLNKAEMVQYEPPKDLGPIECGLILSNLRFDTKFISAGIIDLAVKKVLKIEEIPKKGLLSKKDFRLTFLQSDFDKISSLTPTENALAKALSGFVKGDSLLLNSLKNKFYSSLPEIEKTGKDLLFSKKYFGKKGFTYRIFLFILAVIIIPITIGILSVVASTGGNAILATDSLFATVIILIIFAILMPSRTVAGEEVAWEIKGFKLFMTVAEKYRAPFHEKEGLFEKYLPYAMIFGVTEMWVENMKKIYGEDYFNSYHPLWYYGYIGNFDAETFSNSITDLSSSMASTLASSPSSSGSGGGGFSGGGGGGGGGGGW
ncbi:MAG: DUF2207 domain-containing protein [bacterium]|nr:DUF2207 domain-containing protein [bacterium]